MLSTAKPETLYQSDYVLWLDDTINRLRQHNFAELDVDNLIEELEDLDNERRNAVVSLLDQIIRHLLLLECWQAARDYNSTHWQGEIYSFRVQLGDRLTKTLHNYLLSELDRIYVNYPRRIKDYGIGFLPKELLSIPKNSESYILAIGGLPSS